VSGDRLSSARKKATDRLNGGDHLVDSLAVKTSQTAQRIFCSHPEGRLSTELMESSLGTGCSTSRCALVTGASTPRSSKRHWPTTPGCREQRAVRSGRIWVPGGGAVDVLDGFEGGTSRDLLASRVSRLGPTLSQIGPCCPPSTGPKVRLPRQGLPAL
jgi:hypothetical protein